MKVKLFSGYDTTKLEKEINDFIEDKKFIDLKYCSGVDEFGHSYDSVLIVYEYVPPATEESLRQQAKMREIDKFWSEGLEGLI